MCMKYPAEIFIEIRVCLRLSRSPGPSGSHYHSLSRITIPDETDKTLSNCLQLPPPLSEGLSLLMRSLHQMIILQSPWLGGACGTQEWLSVSEDKRCSDLRWTTELWPEFRCSPLVTSRQEPWCQLFCSDLVTPDSWQCFVKGSESLDKELKEKKRAPTKKGCVGDFNSNSQHFNYISF